MGLELTNDEINSRLRLYGYCELENLKFENYKDGYLKLRSILIPELANENYTWKMRM